MKLLVCVKEVPDATAPRRIDPSSKRLVREGEQVLNPFDSHALEAAVQLKEAQPDAGITITALCMGPASAVRTLHKALALGADDAVHVSDESLAGSDILATARVLAAAVQRSGADLVLMGQQAADSDVWVLPSTVAELLGWPIVTQASTLQVADGAATVDRQTETGYEKLKATLPAVISVSDALNEPRYPSLKAIMGAKRKPLEALAASDLGIDAASIGHAGSATTVLELSPPPPRAQGVKFEDDGSGAEKIAEFLAEKNLV